jgi:hypothetical protein
MTMKTQQSSKAASAAPGLIVFGVDDHDKPRASVFSAKLAPLARTAVDHLKLRTLEATTAETQAVAAQLPAGRMQADGQPFVPYVRRDLYDQLVALADAAQAGAAAPSPPAATAAAAAPGLPPTWDAIATGHVVIAQDDYADEGWWEATVLGRTNDVLTLRWRDYPKYKPFTRHVAAVALLNPTSK